MVLGVEVVIEHVKEVSRLSSLFAEVNNALIDLIGDAVLVLRAASHQGRQNHIALGTHLLNHGSELLHALNGLLRVLRLEHIIITHMQKHKLCMDRVVHLDRLAQVLHASTADEFDALELLGGQRLHLAVLVTARLLLRSTLKVSLENLQLRLRHQVANNQQITAQPQRQLQVQTAQPRLLLQQLLRLRGVHQVQIDISHIQATQVSLPLIAHLAMNEDPESPEVLNALNDLLGQLIDMAIEEPDVAILLVHRIVLINTAVLQVSVKSNVIQVAVQLTLTRKVLLIELLALLRANHAHLLRWIVQQHPQSLHTRGTSHLIGIFRG